MHMLTAGGQEGYCDLRVRKTFFNYQMDLPVALANPSWEQWRLGAPQTGLGYCLVRQSYLFCPFLFWIFCFSWQSECSFFDFDIFWPHPTRLIILPSVEGAPQPPRPILAPGYRNLFDGSPHTRAAYFMASNLFEPRTLATLRSGEIVNRLRAAHPFMVGFRSHDFFLSSLN